MSRRRPMKPCGVCGHDEVEQHVYPLYGDRERTHEGVYTTCLGCGNRRGSWERKRSVAMPA